MPSSVLEVEDAVIILLMLEVVLSVVARGGSGRSPPRMGLTLSIPAYRSGNEVERSTSESPS
jgi:hypothetical protein